ncbi:hypothetical protein [Pseudomonas nitroreducens]|uniref:hypothetical protein n=1 Tax=Pseudomonas nitroreducens TaxID=46680 RepID=UPI00265B4FF0|nr:hypothetical protein [Pseudomonas nitroreducens]MCP1651644.1 hypothetical protein [Pseudomonas nitroreducens]MCP1684491.1 hypothetical protein [Pseudomonas nitroreducens]
MTTKHELPADLDNYIAGLRIENINLKLAAKQTERALAGMLFAFDDGVGQEWSADLLDFARKLVKAKEFDASQQREQATAAENAQVHPEQAEGAPCQGRNCGTTEAKHSPECMLEAAITFGCSQADLHEAAEAVFAKIDRLMGKAEGAQGEREDWSAFDDGVDWSCFPGYLIDHCEGDTITEEGLQFALSAMLKDDDYLRIQSEKARAALAQPSPMPKSGDYSDQEWINAGCQAGQPSPAPELEQLRYKAELYDEVWALVTGKGYMNVTTAISELENEIARLRSYESEWEHLLNDHQQQRDAAQARVAELEKQEPVYTKPNWNDNYGWSGGHVDFKCAQDVRKLAHHFEDLLDAVPEGPLYASPVAQAGQVPEGCLIELGFDVLDRQFRFVDAKSHLPTIKVVLPACEVDDSAAWELRDSVAARIGTLLAAAPAQGGSTDE